jgi:hypothetical protein
LSRTKATVVQAQYGLDLSLFFHQLFANRIGSFFDFDVIVASLVLWVVIFCEDGRIAMRHFCLPVVASLVVGVSLGLPLFPYMRRFISMQSPSN